MIITLYSYILLYKYYFLFYDLVCILHNFQFINSQHGIMQQQQITINFEQFSYIIKFYFIIEIIDQNS